MPKQKEANVYCTYGIMLRGCDKIYIGMTENYSRRFYQHIESCIRAASDPSPSWADGSLYSEFAQRGCALDDVMFYIIHEGMTHEQAYADETMLIEKYRSYNPRFGWNKYKQPTAIIRSQNVIHGDPPVGGIQ